MPLIRRFVLLVVVGIVGSSFPLLATASRVQEVVVQGYQFTPAQVEIRAGDTVRWVNREKRTSHSVFFAGENSLESDRIFPGESWERTFTQPGVYTYTCGPHPEMAGMVTVTQ